MSRLDFATAPSPDQARILLFGANTQGAGFSQSARGVAGEAGEPRTTFSADFVREADNESPSLTERLGAGERLFDLGNLSLEDLTPEAQVQRVTGRFAEIFRSGKAAICLGGDHLIKYAGLKAASEVFDDVAVLYFDAHPDCAMEERLFFGSILHHAWQLPGLSPSATSIVALRQVNAQEQQGLAHWKPGVVLARDFEAGVEAVLAQLEAQLGGRKRLFLSMDLDGLVPHEVPAVEAPYPGGPTLQQLLVLLERMSQRWEFVGMDVCEFIPAYDPLKLTALCAARLVKEVAALMR